MCLRRTQWTKYQRSVIDAKNGPGMFLSPGLKRLASNRKKVALKAAKRIIEIMSEGRSSAACERMISRTAILFRSKVQRTTKCWSAMSKFGEPSEEIR